MAPSLPTRSSSSPPESLGSRTSDLPIDHALSLLLADEAEAALRWSAAALERDPWSPAAIIVTSRVLSQMARTRAAVDGLLLAVARAIDAGDLPLAIVAIDQLRGLGVSVAEPLDDVASAFCSGSGRLHAQPFSPAREGNDFQPLSPLLTGESLAAKATQVLLATKHAESVPGTELAAVARLPLFSALSREALRDFLEALETTFVPPGYRLLQEGKDSGAAYIVGTGNLEISRRAPEGGGRPRTVLGRVGRGALVGEVALMSHLPSAVSVTATTASILLVARRSAVEPVATKHAELGVELAAFCRRHAVANLGWASTLAAAIPAPECANLVERLETRTFERGEKLVAHGEEAQGLHLIVSGEVAVVAREGGGRVMLATRSAGETVGEVELVLCQKANVDAIAVRSTATLLLPPEEFFALVRESPATLHGLYAIAVRRHAELRHALEQGFTVGGDDFVLDDEVSSESLLEAANGHADGLSAQTRRTPPPPLPREVSLPTPTPPPVGTYSAPPPARSAAARAASSAPSPFNLSPTAPTEYAAHAEAPRSPFVPPAPSQAPASFIPPAIGPSPFGASQPPAYAPSSFAPPGAAPQSFHPNGSVPPAVGAAGPHSHSRMNWTMALAAVTALVSVFLVVFTVLDRRPELLTPAAGAGHATPDTAITVVETPPPPPLPAASVSAAAASAAPHTLVVPAFRGVRAHTPATRANASEPVAASQAESATASPGAATAATPATGTAESKPASTAAGGSTDDFGGRQ